MLFINKKIVQPCVLIEQRENFFENGNARYYTNDKAQCSDDVRFIGKEKYPKKTLMRIGISNRDMSKPYFDQSNSVAVNTDIFINECLKLKLVYTQASW